jgi:methyl-accepting chemotaxis protein
VTDDELARKRTEQAEQQAREAVALMDEIGDFVRSSAEEQGLNPALALAGLERAKRMIEESAERGDKTIDRKEHIEAMSEAYALMVNLVPREQRPAALAELRGRLAQLGLMGEPADVHELPPPGG